MDFFNSKALHFNKTSTVEASLHDCDRCSRMASLAVELISLELVEAGDLIVMVIETKKWGSIRSFKQKEKRKILG